MKSQHRSQRGFTLVEIIFVLVILSILTTIAIFKYIDLQRDARRAAISGGVAEFNTREKLLWGKYILLAKNTGRTVKAFDRLIYDYMDPYLDSGHPYTSGGGACTTLNPGDNWQFCHVSYGDANTGTEGKATLAFQKKATANIQRIPATFISPARWYIKSFI